MQTFELLCICNYMWHVAYYCLPHLRYLALLILLQQLVAAILSRIILLAEKAKVN